ncbi:uncharacterized protein [Triticum aestivum]|uniref:uncharacterized protein n=1 Tax=Triticum aestivum TaxID=4565 RepID=UPI001D034D19|nr:uncharacterized protein LOC123170883 [Triticum aestivum]
MYPPIGGPFQSLQEADDAIVRHLDDLRDKTVCLADLSLMEKAVRHALYWPDGTRKKLSKSSVDPERINHTRLLVQALLDKYNEDHNLLGNLAYELKDIMCIRSICEGRPHNCRFCTSDTEFVLSCFYMLKPNDNGHCRGCTYNKRVNLKHPNDADEFSGGHLDPYLPYGGDTTIQYSGSDENLDAEEEEARLQAKEEARKPEFATTKVAAMIDQHEAMESFEFSPGPTKTVRKAASAEGQLQRVKVRAKKKALKVVGAPPAKWTAMVPVRANVRTTTIAI